MRKIISIGAIILVLIATSITAGIYWKNQQTIQNSVHMLKRSVTKNLPDPESVRFRSIQLQSLDGSIRERLTLIDSNFLWESTPQKLLSFFRYDPKGFQLCGEFNAKNGFGVYAGYKYFHIAGGENQTPLIDEKDNEDGAKIICDTTKELVIFSEPTPE